ncbi:LOW QUALITY PROTEIN: sal-like protein 1 [Lingula anatina]|uniref:Homeotic protein spalt-major n=1 Tax=Lingula anatina TaxID=7574 RepID=A0A1S3IF94_LINAN|nr:LOW QUALITY PROTEIN: sal-like protein 1 [Lingula anatina]|eukprot:XP_013396129.1 LOW QUALITY PROTEIN: sal-like protein 1 [Lingula anatina]
MSRRKQTKPRHLEAEAEEGVLAGLGDGEMSPVVETDDAHVCGICRAQFYDLSDFLTHKKNCSSKRIVVIADGEDKNQKDSDEANIMKQNDNSQILAPSSTSSVISEDDKMELEMNAAAMSEDPESKLNQNQNDNDDLLDEEFDQDAEDEFSKMDDSMEEDDVDELSNMGIKMSDLDEQDVISSRFLPQYGWPPITQPSLTSLLPSNNVKLEPLEGTKAAVSQFVENNANPSDLLFLHATLSSLQQQQLIQLTLIQQLQHQIMTGIPAKSDGQTSPSQSAMAALTASALNPNISPSYALPPTSVATPSGASLPQGASSVPLINGTTIVTTQEKESSSSSSAMSNIISSLSNPFLAKNEPQTVSTTVSPITSPFIRELTNLRKGKPPNVTVGMERSHYASDDPFFKHKCRFCHKVFGSDSALQIHVRSHTGERPFKCNVCGNRFSTKGNLKVHFSRHKARYPHIKMNPHPVPEYLDREPSKPRGMLLPSTLTSVSAPPHLLSQHSSSDDGTPLPPTSVPLQASASMSTQASAPSAPPSTSAEPPPESPTPSEQKSQDTAAVVAPPAKEEATVPPMSTAISTTDAEVPAPSGPPAVKCNTSPLVSPIPATLPPFPLPDETGSKFHSSGGSPDKDPVESMEEFMEITPSETSKLQRLVDSLDRKVTDPNQCAICNRVLSCKSALQMHYRIHTGERPFKCKICGRAFTTKGNLKTHMGVHRVKSPMRLMHQCPVCHKQFTNVLVLQQHIRMHTAGISTSMPHYPPPFRREDSLPYRPLSAIPMSHLPEQGLDLRKDINSPEKKEISAADRRLENDELHEAMDTDSHHLNGNTEPREDAGDMDSDAEERSGTPEKLSQNRTSHVSASSGSPLASPSGSTNSGEIRYNLTPLEEMQKAYSAYAAAQFGGHSPWSLGMPYSTSSMMSPPSVITSPYGSYSMSLAALEERVNAIDNKIPRPPGGDTGKKEVTPTEEENLDHHQPQQQQHPLRDHITSALQREKDYKYNNDEEENPSATDSVRQLERMTQEMEKRNESQSPSPKPPGPNGEMSSPERPAFTDSDADRSRSPPMVKVGHTSHRSQSPAGSACSVDSAGDLSNASSQGGLPFDNASTTCNICYKTFACRSALGIHYRSHTKERPFKCEACDKRFSTKGNMRQHMLTHNVCDLSSKALANNNNMEEHGVEVTKKEGHFFAPSKEENKPRTEEAIKTHHHTSAESRPPESSRPRQLNKHQCSVCYKQFSSASALQIHFRTHTGDKPFKCTVCGKAFTTKGNLKVHMGTHMWNNSPSRRGRRMSVENPLALSMNHKEAEYLGSFSHRSPNDIYFQYPPFMNGLASKMNEISVIQGLNGSFGPLPNPMLMNGYLPTSSTAEAYMKANAYFPITTTASVEHRDRSVSPAASPPSPSKSVNSENESRKSSPVSPTPDRSLDSPRSQTWVWKTTCHICSKMCSSPGALELHLKSHYASSAESPKPIAAS